MEGLERFAAALPPTEFEAPCDCDYCMLQYAGHNASADLVLSYAGHLSNEAAAKRAGEYTESIQKNRQHIICMINNHGNAILKKWRRDQQYRRKTLLKVDPSIYPTRNPMLSMLGTPGSTSSEDLTNSRRAFLLPYINLEDLIGDGSNLIKLLHKRCEFPLEQWVPFDNAQLKPAWKQALLRVSSAYGCIVMHGPEFGRWKAFDEDEVHRGDAYGTPRGLLILQAQKALFSFLRATIDEISGGSVAHDVQSRLVTAPLLPITAPTAACDKWLPFLNALSSREGPRSSFGSAFAEQPFSSPPVFDVDTLLDISENRAAQAQDELWLLQTDLVYFVGVAGYFQSQWYDRVPGVTDIHDLDEEEKYDNVGHTITEKVLIRATNWQWLRELCQSVQREFRISMTDIHAGEELPEIYETELGFLFTVVKNCLFQEQTDLQRLTLKSREFQHNFRVKRTIDTSHGWGWGLEYEFNNYKDSYRAERIGWCFYHLVQDSECSTSFENALVLQHLDNYLNSQPKEEAERLDQEIYRCLSDIAALERMAELLEYHRPIFVLPDPEELRQDPRQIFQIKGKLQQASDSTNHLRGLGQALKPLCGFSLPEKRDMKWLAQRDLGCQKLSNFWMVARNTYQARLQAVSIPQALIDPQLALMEACDSPENIA